MLFAFCNKCDNESRKNEEDNHPFFRTVRNYIRHIETKNCAGVSEKYQKSGKKAKNIEKDRQISTQDLPRAHLACPAHLHIGDKARGTGIFEQKLFSASD